MLQTIPNDLNSERSVELRFMDEIADAISGRTILDVGGIPTLAEQWSVIVRKLTQRNQYFVSDFRGGQFQGDFVQYPFGDKKFDVIMFISSLEHFPQCTESDLVFREGYDIRAIEKAKGMLNPGGRIILTVPYGKQFRWQPYHHTYNMDSIKKMFNDMYCTHSHHYGLVGNEWKVFTEDFDWYDPSGRVHGVLCAIFEKK